MAAREIALPEDYQDLLKILKDRVRGTRAQALRTVNTQLIGLYWSIGRDILQRQDAEGWGSGIIARLADGLRAEFPEMKGLSRSNLFYMRGFAAGWPEPIVQQPVGQLPWGHITVLLDKLETAEIKKLVRRSGRGVRVVVQRAAEYGYGPGDGRTGSAPSNFAEVLPAPVSELAQQAAKDPYNFEFLGLTGEVAELTASEIDKG